MLTEKRAIIKSLQLLSLLLALAAVSLCCAGCGGGGGGGNSGTLGLSVTPPQLTGKTGQQISLPVEVTGTGTVNTASVDIHFNSGVFNPVLSGNSIAVEMPSANAVCRYKWINAQTIRVMYASSDGITGGDVLVSIPLDVLSEGQANLTLQNIAVNE